MSEYMLRFLKSIGIDNIESFDMDFVCLKKQNNGIWKMDIHKNTSWSFDQLNEFKTKLINIDYPYEMHFTYEAKISAQIEFDLLKNWYKNIYRVDLDVDNINIENGYVNVVFISEEVKKNKGRFIKDFIEFLDFIGYPNLIKESIQGEDITLESIEEAHQEYIEAVAPILAKQEEMISEYEKRYGDGSGFAKRGNYQKLFIKDIDTNSGNVEFDCNVFDLEIKKSRKDTLIGTFYVCDETYSIVVKMLENKILNADKINSVTKGKNIKVRGNVSIDKFSNELAIIAHYVDVLEDTPLRSDNAPEKRVELHLHTKMSAMDGCATITDYCKLAKNMGHKAIGLTDHGVVQAFPEAQKASDKYGIKLLYGCEFYMVDGNLSYIMNPKDILLNKATYVAFDFETTGLSARYDKIIEFGAVKYKDGIAIGKVDILVNPGEGIVLSSKITNLTNITNDMLKGKPTIDVAIHEIKEFIGDAILVSHNAEFDVGFLDAAYKANGLGPVTNPVIDTLSLSRYLFPTSRNHRLGTLCRNMEVNYDEDKAHRADYDAEVLLEVWMAMLSLLTKDNIDMKHKDLGDIAPDVELLKHIRPSHVIVYAKNAQGLKDLFRLVSMAHIDYLSDIPKIPRSEIMKYRENFLIGSACANGEVFDTALTRTEDILLSKMSFYDYIEIQPLDNYVYLVNEEQVDSLDDVKKYVLDIISAARKLNKLICATGDAHYLNPEDKIYRDVYIMAKGIGGVRHPLNPFRRDRSAPYENPNQHFRSTDEMLEQFNFLPKEEAIEYVVTNTNKIADMCEELRPIKDKLYTPTIENCADKLKELCYEKCHAWYGDELPPIVAERLEKELNGIITHNYSVIYYIAHKLIKRANEDGFMVGSRGSVGSSFVATMASITEVNPLPAHYRCPKCRHSEFVHIDGITSGFDLPPKKCPHCGSEYIRDGQDIPFATFLGFNADKVPDIDLNFSGEYQATAHELTKELLGKDNVFKAGTIETVAEKSAYGYVLGYFERIGMNPDSISKAEIRRIALGCMDVKRTTGQHPGGIVVIPRDYEVYDFTPIQYPADEKESSWKTTHFDFHAIHDNVLKLDLLGHVDPTAMRMFRDFSDTDPKDVPMSDPETLSLFSSPDALKLNHNYLHEETGALGLPEFGTQFVRGMLKDTRPKKFADLLILSGLSHGTGVWMGNADELIKNKTCTLSDVIGCRDDIMVTLSRMGVEPSTAFKIMEDVRKGKKVKPEYEEIMKKNNVPQWYIDSCNKIQYMFPKAHATAYVMMAIRVAWYKVHRPLDFYANYFSIRTDKFDLDAMIGGEDSIIHALESLNEKKKTREGLSAKEEEIEKSLSMSLEMVDRGYRFGHLDLYKSDSRRFIVDKETGLIIPPFIAIDGLGLAAAQSVIDARKEGPFLSKEDLIKRTKLNSQNIAKIEEQGALKDLDDSNQMDLFSFNF